MTLLLALIACCPANIIDNLNLSNVIFLVGKKYKYTCLSADIFVFDFWSEYNNRLHIKQMVLQKQKQNNLTLKH